MLSLSALPNAILFALTGLLLFAIAAAALFRIFLNDLWHRAVAQSDVSAALVVVALLLGLAYIVGSAVH